MSTVIIGGNGRAAIQRLIDAYPHMSPDEKAAAVALEVEICAQVDSFLHHGHSHDENEQ